MKLYPLDMLLAVGGSDNLMRKQTGGDNTNWNQKKKNQIQSKIFNHIRLRLSTTQSIENQ